MDQVGYHLILHNPGTQPIGHMSPKWYDYQEIIKDLAGDNSDFPEASQFDIEFWTDDVAIFTLNGTSLGYENCDSVRQNRIFLPFIIDNIHRKIKNGNFAFLFGETEKFLMLIPGDNILYIEGAYNVKVRFRPMYG